MTKQNGYRLLGFVILCLGAVIMVLPLLWMLTTALKTSFEAQQAPPVLLPHHWQWQNFKTAWQAAPFTRYLLNSLMVAFLVTIGQLVISTLAAYAFARLQFYGKRVLFILCLTTLLIPGEMLLIPNFVTITQLHWFDTYRGLVLPPLANFFSVLLLKQAFESIPTVIYQAARLDGAGDLRCLLSVGLPLVRPTLVTVGLLQIIASWNAFMWPLVATNSEQYRTLPVGLQSFTAEAGTQYQLLMAASTLAMIPLILVYLSGQRYLMQGLSRTGLKG